jgi:hypothetical protein
VSSKEASSQTASKQAVSESEEAREPVATKKRPKRKKPEELSTDSIGSSIKKEKKETISLTERLQQLEAEIEEREGKAEDVKMADEPEEDSKAGNVRRFYDIDKVRKWCYLISYNIRKLFALKCWLPLKGLKRPLARYPSTIP